MENSFAMKDLTGGQLNALVKKLGGHEAALDFLRGNTKVVPVTDKWHVQGGLTRFSVTSDMTTGWDWGNRLKGNGIDVRESADFRLRSHSFNDTISMVGVTYEIVVLRGMSFEPTTSFAGIRREAQRCGFGTPTMEIACLIREKFDTATLKEMGFTAIVTMHDPIDQKGETSLLISDFRDRRPTLGTCYGGDDGSLTLADKTIGFAFVVAQSRV